MRAILFALGLVLAPLTLVPTASAGSACWSTGTGFLCCSWPDPIGQPGSPGYLVTSLPGQVIFTTCGTVAIAPGTAEGIVGAVLDAVDCIVFHTNC